MQKQNHIPDFSLLAKHFADETSDAEKQEVQKWIDSGNEAEFEKNQVSWNAFDSTKVTFDTESALDKVNDRIRKQKSKKTIRFISIAVAAIMLFIAVPLLVLELGNNDFEQEIISYISQDTVSVVNLDDGSQLTLNEGSKIEYDKNFEENRTVQLDGEAYFEVNHIGDDNRFVVVAKNVNITVVGTKFNVKAIEGSEIVEVSVTEGIVRVQQNMSEEYEELLAGDKIKINTSTNEIVMDTTEVLNDLFWITKKIVFNNSDIGEVASTLSNIYGVDVQVEIKNPEELRINTGFENNSLEEVLRILELTLDISIIEKNGSILIKDAE